MAFAARSRCPASASHSKHTSSVIKQRSVRQIPLRRAPGAWARGFASVLPVDPSTQRVYGRRPRRVLFNIPGSEDKFLSKAATLEADVLVFDFEDGVALNKKDEARKKVIQALNSGNFGRAERSVRINSVRSGFEYADLEALKEALPRVDSILLPKTESPEDLKLIDAFLSANGDAAGRVKILAAIESGAALLNLREICFKSTPRLDALIFGSEDYCADVGITRTDSAEELLWARSELVTFASAAQLQAIDMVCIKFKDDDQLKRECIQGFNMGFDGKQAIHPGQISTIYDTMKPAEAAIAQAQRIVSEYKKNADSGKGAWVVEGKMIDMPMVRHAMRVLQKANLLGLS